MKTIKVQEAVGTVLCHDMTQIVKDGFKGPRFKKGHRIREEDIPILLEMGKEHVYVYECGEDHYHENDAAIHLANLCKGDNIYSGEIREGKMTLFAACDGLLKVNVNLLDQVNATPMVTIATKWNNSPVKKDDPLAGTRVIPLVVEKEIIDSAEDLVGDEKILQVLPYRPLKAGLITTGNEVYYGRIKDQFTDVIRDKMRSFPMTEIGHHFSRDNKEEIAQKIQDLLDKKAQIIFCSGGMSVDPDDNTPGAIASMATEVISYGTPVLPGSMFMLAYYKEIPIIGLPGCVMFSKQTVFDLILPRVAAGERVRKEEIVALGHGGFL